MLVTRVFDFGGVVQSRRSAGGEPMRVKLDLRVQKFTTYHRAIEANIFRRGVKSSRRCSLTSKCASVYELTVAYKGSQPGAHTKNDEYPLSLNHIADCQDTRVDNEKWRRNCGRYSNRCKLWRSKYEECLKRSSC